jgi:hypothetical protein
VCRHRVLVVARRRCAADATVESCNCEGARAAHNDFDPSINRGVPGAAIQKSCHSLSKCVDSARDVTRRAVARRLL